MPQFIVSSYRSHTIEADDIWQAAAITAADESGLDCDDICYDPFSFAINDTEFTAEIAASGPHGTGTIRLSMEGITRTIDESGCFIDESVPGTDADITNNVLGLIFDLISDEQNGYDVAIPFANGGLEVVRTISGDAKEPRSLELRIIPESGTPRTAKLTVSLDPAE